MVSPDPDVVQVIERERLLLSPPIRCSRSQVDLLLDPEFQEVGASGRVWPRTAVLDALEQEDGDGDPIEDVEMTGRRLADDLILLTYVSDRRGRRARRTSIWRRGQDGWRILHHQGTLLP